MTEIEPLFQQLNFQRIAPLASTVMLIAGIGFYAGWKSQEGALNILKEWVQSLINK